MATYGATFKEARTETQIVSMFQVSAQDRQTPGDDQ